jgi:hypothetical protein
MATKDKTLVINVEYRLAITDEKAAAVLAELAENKGLNFGSDNYGIWDFSPVEKVTSTSIE